MNIIIGDIGNTFTKICVIDEKSLKIIKEFRFESSKIYYQNLLNKQIRNLKKYNPFIKSALFSSVVPKYEFLIRKALKKIFKIKLIEIKNKKINKIVKINIKNKNQVGSDRIANAVSVYKKFKANCIVVDFGTATTFDVVTKSGNYIGGVIAPGVNLSIESLSISADQIPFFSLKKQKKAIGKNTIEALRSGFYWGYSGLINNIVLKIEKEAKEKYKIIFTGGYANLFKTSIARPFTIDKNITIKGIVEIVKKNRKYLV